MTGAADDALVLQVTWTALRGVCQPGLGVSRQEDQYCRCVLALLTGAVLRPRGENFLMQLWYIGDRNELTHPHSYRVGDMPPIPTLLELGTSLGG